MKTPILCVLALAASLSFTGVAQARSKHSSLVQSAVSAYEQQHSFQVSAAGSIEGGLQP